MWVLNVAENNVSTAVHVSKRAARRAKRQEELQATKTERRRTERERRKQRAAQLKHVACKLAVVAASVCMRVNTVSDDASTTVVPVNRKRIKHTAITMAASTCRVRVAVDCDYNAYMNDKEVKHVVQQLTYCYASNRRANAPMQLCT
jgi:tRNA (guanine9-N1)-methyltransferase